MSEAQSKHTPGEWSVSELDARGEPSEFYIFIEPGVAVIERKVSGGDQHDMPDAHLLAAAKDLLVALKSAEKALEAIGDEMTVGERYTNAGQYLIDALSQARAAIAKATP